MIPTCIQQAKVLAHAGRPGENALTLTLSQRERE